MIVRTVIGFCLFNVTRAVLMCMKAPESECNNILEKLPFGKGESHYDCTCGWMLVLDRLAEDIY